ncbi:NAD-dependent epimerase/dehydratase family protein [Candidatus Woesearchaeota archaeon]|nr:NAD-dependent epimerase/dehydratase family protein [Candidatus Woesearchaeota archaeon]
MKTLVTGGAGFIGSHVVDELIKNGRDVIILDDLSGGFKENVNPNAKFIEGSITDYELVKKIFEKDDIEYVFHLAAYAAEGLSHFIRRFNYENNLKGSINLINQSVLHGIKCFVFTSSIAVYGADQLPMTEDITPEPEDPYGISKLAVEYDLKAARNMFWLNSIVFRAHNVYGERQNIGDKYRNVIGIFMNSIMQGKPMTIFGDGEQTRAFSNIGDIAPVIARSIDNKEAYNQVFNIGADKPYSINQLAESVKKAMGIQDAEVVHLEERKEVKHAYSDHTKAKEILGFKSTVSLDEGIKSMAEWAKKEGVKKSKEFENIEVGKNMPPSWRNA